MKNSYLYSALVAAVSISVAHAESMPAEKSHIKCYGIAKEGEGDCAGYTEDGEDHSCPGAATKDKDPYAWTYATVDECNQQGGQFSPPPRPPKKTEAAG